MIEVNTTNDSDSTEFLDHMAAIRFTTPRQGKALGRANKCLEAKENVSQLV